MKQRGFTVVELIITITVMTILLALAIVNLNSTQANQRDAERASDVAAIANHLEIYYKDGSSAYPTPGRYPSTVLVSTGSTSIEAFLPDIDIATYTAPGSSSPGTSLIKATNATQTTTGVAPQPTTAQYVYQPLQTDGTLCTTEAQECREFAIYYRTEIDNTVQKVVSKNQ